MDSDLQSTTGVNKPSALPRPTRLPVPNTKTSRLPLSKLQNHSDAPKLNDVAPRVLKKQSISTLTQPRQPNAPLTKSLSAKTNAPVSASRPATKDARTAVSSGMRSVSRNAQSKASSAIVPSTTNLGNEELDDQLSSLDSFRAASRQSSYDEPMQSASDYIEGTEVSETPTSRKHSRPSLSDRTIESIQHLPATPKDRRRSSFFSPIESPMGPPPRPNSSLSRNGSNGSSRPGTSEGVPTRSSARPANAIPTAPQSAQTATRSSVGAFGMTPVSSTRRSLSGAFRSPAQASKNTEVASLPSPLPVKPTSNATQAKGVSTAKISRGSKTVAVRQAKTRPLLSDAFGPTVRGEVATQNLDSGNTAATKSAVINSTSSKNSSAALREQIAAAKAAARKEKGSHASPRGPAVSYDDSIEMGAHIDPFNQAPRDEKHMLRNRINTARTDGKLNIAAMSLKQIPDEVLNMYSAAAMEEGRVSWAEVVDLTRLNAADNAIEELSDSLFPDKSAGDFDLDDQAECSQFAGLEMLDLHGNMLASLPIGTRHLQRLTSLNLSHNKLDNSALDIISQISTLKDLKLGHNDISGSLPSSICQLANLESLDIRSNRLLSLPEAMRELVSLRMLNVSGNQLTTLPMDALHELRLSELDASGNALIGSLFPMGSQSFHSALQVLNVANNSLAALTFDMAMDLPRLHTLDVSCNNLTGLPPATGWTELITLLASDNKIGELPVGFTSLRKLRNVNLTSNELRSIDPEIGRMESLESLILASNPLRERKFLNMSASDMKRNLRARLGPGETEGATSVEQETIDIAVSSLPRWTVKANASLDLSGGGHKDDVDEHLGKFLTDTIVKRLHLQSNALTAFLPSLAFGNELRLLDLSGNPFRSNYLTSQLCLPSLEDLNLSGCSVTTLTPLTTHLRTPKLHTLNLTANRLSGPLESLRAVFPALINLLASDNRIRSITAEALRGLQVVNLASNDIELLPAEIGLLWDEGLRNLEVGRNVFRVPNHRVLEKGTEATMRWLRNKLPAPGDAEELEQKDS